MAQRLEFAAKLSEIVELAVIDQHRAGRPIHHGLMASGSEIDNAQPQVRKPNAGSLVAIKAVIIRPTMTNCCSHSVEYLGCRLVAGYIEPPCYAAHFVPICFNTPRFRFGITAGYVVLAVGKLPGINSTPPQTRSVVEFSGHARAAHQRSIHPELCPPVHIWVLQ